MFSRWAYVLIGNDKTGKTSFQRNLIDELCNEKKDRLTPNTLYRISHPRAPKCLQTVFTCNRSYQEKIDKYISVENYFKEFFREADICFLSSHTEGPAHEDIEEIINQLKMRCYNVAGIFWSNSFNKEAMRISLLPWQERLWISNPRFDSKEEISAQLIRIAHNFSELLIQRAHTQ